MRLNGFWLPSRSACWPARALCFTLCIALLLLPSPIFGLSPIERLNSIENRLQNIVIYSQKLEGELENSQRISREQQQIISGLLSELASLRSELSEQRSGLESSNASLESSRLRVGELLSTIDELEAKLKPLSESCENIAQPLRDALTIAEKELRRQKIKTVIYVILAAVAAGAAGYGIGRLAD